MHRADKSYNLLPALTGAVEWSSELSSFVDSAIQLSYQCFDAYLKDVTYPQKRCNGNRSARLDLLPVTSGKSKAYHVFLRVLMRFPQLADPLSQCTEKALLIYHALSSKVLKLGAPRAD